MTPRSALSALLFSAALLAGCAAPSEPPPAAPGQAPASHTGNGPTEVLIYAGAGSWGPEVESLASVLYRHGATYQQVSSAELDAMSLDEISGYKLLIVPGGDVAPITRSLSADARSRLREAVQQRGMSYLGFCAGAWLAVAPAPLPGQDVTYGVGVVDGPIQQPTSLYKQGRAFAIAKAWLADGTRRELLWYGGPITPNVPGGVFARYPDGTAAITQLRSGQGLVIVSGLHPAATPLVLRSLGLSSAEAVAPDLAWKLLEAGIQRKPLPAF